jgi:O-antigen ligase
MAYWRVYPAIRPPNGDLPGTFGALHPHDAYLSLAGETGLIGLAAFAYGWLRVARSAASSLASRLPRERLLALGIAAGLVAVLVQGIFDTVGVVQMSFVWIPYTGLLLAAAGRVRI